MISFYRKSFWGESTREGLFSKSPSLVLLSIVNLVVDGSPGSGANVCIVVPHGVSSLGGNGEAFQIQAVELDLVANHPQLSVCYHGAAVGAGEVGVAHAKRDIVVTGVDRPNEAALGNVERSSGAVSQTVGDSNDLVNVLCTFNGYGNECYVEPPICAGVGLSEDGVYPNLCPLS